MGLRTSTKIRFVSDRNLFILKQDGMFLTCCLSSLLSLVMGYFSLGLYRLCSTTFEQLKAFGAIFEQFLRTFEQFCIVISDNNHILKENIHFHKTIDA